jgi:hypothetical protein
MGRALGIDRRIILRWVLKKGKDSCGSVVGYCECDDKLPYSITSTDSLHYLGKCYLFIKGSAS